MGAKVLSVIIEDEVTFMTDADIEFVSLVKHGANRTPFKILKTDKGGSSMDKVISAVLIPKDLTDEEVATLLEGYRNDTVKEYDSYNSYTQVEEDTIQMDTVEVIFLDKEKVTKIVEKPTDMISNLISTGIYRFTPEIFKAIRAVGEEGNHDLTAVVDYMIERGETLSGIRGIGKWMDAVYP